MNLRGILILVLVFSLNAVVNAQTVKVAQTPPMGWNSYYCYGAGVKENEVLDNADFMGVHLKSYGWQYVVVGYCWYYPNPGALNDPPQKSDMTPWLNMDKYGRLLPDAVRFPSSNSHGFKPLAKAIHEKGLKFGIHIMRGIPRQAVIGNTRIKGTKFHARDIADTTSQCSWLNHMYGIDMDKPGAQEYYNSVFKLYAKWGVDFVKVDDISSPLHEKELIAIRKAMDQCGRPMILSLSPGETPLAKAEVVKEYADTWRISYDVWDNWKSVERMFSLLHSWEKHIGNGHFADADLLGIGKLACRGPVGEPRQSNLSRNEMTTMMILWSIARSPLMYGGDLGYIRNFELSLLQNQGAISVNQNSTNNHQLFRNENQMAWIADIPGSKSKYLAIFNLGENAELIHIDLKEAGFNGKCTITDQFTGDLLGEFETGIRPEVLSHGARLLRIDE